MPTCLPDCELPVKAGLKSREKSPRLKSAVGSREKDYVELPGGHISLIAGRGAALHCWPKVSGWLAPRS